MIKNSDGTERAGITRRFPLGTKGIRNHLISSRPIRRRPKERLLKQLRRIERAALYAAWVLMISRITSTTRSSSSSNGELEIHRSEIEIGNVFKQEIIVSVAEKGKGIVYSFIAPYTMEEHFLGLPNKHGQAVAEHLLKLSDVAISISIEERSDVTSAVEELILLLKANI